MINKYQDRLGDARRAPRTSPKDVAPRTGSVIHEVAGIVVRKCLEGRPDGFTARQVVNDSPGLAAGYRTANALGTALGDGVRGKGLGLHRDRHGRFCRCRDNAALAASRLGDAELAALAADLGYPDVVAMIDAIDALPDPALAGVRPTGSIPSPAVAPTGE